MRYRRRKYVTLLQNGQPTRFDYGEIDHCCQNFALVDGWLDARGLQRLGTVGRARSRLARSRDVVAVVIERLRQDETAFLHPFGIDEATKRWPAWKGEPDPLQAVRQQVFGHRPGAVERRQERRASRRRRRRRSSPTWAGRSGERRGQEALNLFEH